MAAACLWCSCLFKSNTLAIITGESRNAGCTKPVLGLFHEDFPRHIRGLIKQKCFKKVQILGSIAL